MSLKIETTSKFKRKAKALHKKYPSFKKELDDLITKLEANPTLGAAIKHDCYKIRLSIKSKAACELEDGSKGFHDSLSIAICALSELGKPSTPLSTE